MCESAVLLSRYLSVMRRLGSPLDRGADGPPFQFRAYGIVMSMYWEAQAPDYLRLCTSLKRPSYIDEETGNVLVAGVMINDDPVSAVLLDDRIQLVVQSWVSCAGLMPAADHLAVVLPQMICRLAAATRSTADALDIVGICRATGILASPGAEPSASASDR